jgi:hypothetical protein
VLETLDLNRDFGPSFLAHPPRERIRALSGAVHPLIFLISLFGSREEAGHRCKGKRQKAKGKMKAKSLVTENTEDTAGEIAETGRKSQVRNDRATP